MISKIKNSVRFFLSLALALIFVFIVDQDVTPAFACTLPPGGIPKYTIADQVNAAQVVLEGTVMAITSTTGFNETATVTVLQYFKGNGPANLRINNFGSSAACLTMVSPGTSYIFYANGNPDSGLVSAFYLYSGAAVATPDPATLSEILATTGQTPASPRTASAGGANENPSITTLVSATTEPITTAQSGTTPALSLTPAPGDTSTAITPTAAPTPTTAIPLKNDDINRILGIVLIGLVAGLSVIFGATIWRRGRNRKGRKNK